MMDRESENAETWEANQSQEHELGLAALEAVAEQTVSGEDAAVFRAFVRHYYERVAPEVLRQRAPEELIELARSHFEFGRRRQPQQVLVRAGVPDERPLASIETCFEDMPFLVDTAAMAVRAAGLTIDWAAHPVLRVRRDAAGELHDVQGPAPGGNGLESWIHMQFEPPEDDKVYAAIESGLREALEDLGLAYRDLPTMRQQARDLAAQLDSARSSTIAEDELREAAAFMHWLSEENFIFLGTISTVTRVSDGGRSGFEIEADRSLGLSREGRRYADFDTLLAPKAELDRYAESPRVVVISKAMLRSTIHAPEFLDVISVKRVNADGQIIGTCRFVGLFAPDVYVDRPRSIPLIRRKADYVVRRAKFPEDSFSGKQLREILFFLPRDELFQSSEEELFRVCMGVRALRERQQLRLFMRRDRYGRFFSFMAYMPRERYTRDLRDRMQQVLGELLPAESIDRTVDFLRGGLARIRYIVRTPPGTQIALGVTEIEERLIVATRSWREQLRDVLQRQGRADGARLVGQYADAFPLSYIEAFAPIEAAADLQFVDRLSHERPLLARLIVRDSNEGTQIAGVRLYSFGRAIALSDVLPTLEEFGLRVIRQEPAEINPRSGPVRWIQSFDVEAARATLPPDTLKTLFESALQRVLDGVIESDQLSRLVIESGLDWRQVSCLRMLSRYVNQIGLPYGHGGIVRQVAAHAEVAAQLVELFELRFDPQLPAAEREAGEVRLLASIEQALDAVTSLDADRVLRAVLSVIKAGLRTNYYQLMDDGQPKPWISLKLDPSQVPELPQPRPAFEIWVYSPEVEGVHLRGGRIARGGLRWSDRLEDFRTEVLGLMKAQMVKNAVIVPVGAKGGFVVKRPVNPADREAWMAQGIACYKTFLRGLLDITDNRAGDAIIAPAATLRHDGDDPYLVVAADKGTASFSDIANGMSAEYGFWLGDAFASGGSRGYDHKKMGITARGAWESVKRHFREMDRDIQTEPFTCVGVGDMSGDVFGNGMLLSRQIHLIAAFDHRHIFIDPAPDAQTSFAERERLFALPRSSWADYNATLLSEGGGIWPRSAKSITLSSRAAAALGTEPRVLTPMQLISVILKAPVDLLWNGGVGTYVKSSEESNETVGDRANDSLRVNGEDLRCRVVGEGGNLGFTQRGRIEFALSGGRINTDAIDNSAGVHSSDREVNYKIPLNRLLMEGELAQDERDSVLEQMTPDVARFVLYDNYVQPACLSMEEQHAALRLDDHVALMKLLERGGLLNRRIEFLPDEEGLEERRRDGRGLVRPELAVLVAYAKISLFESAVGSGVLDDPFFIRDLLSYFPPLMRERFERTLTGHRLKLEIVATILANAVVNRMGIGFAHLLADIHGQEPSSVLKAYAVTHEIFSGDQYWQAIEALDNRLPSNEQYELLRRAGGLLKHGTSWMISTRAVESGLATELVQRYQPAVRELGALLPDLLPPSYREDWDAAVAELAHEAVPDALSVQLANTRVLGAALDIAELAAESQVSLALAAGIYFELGERFRILWILASITTLKVSGRWQNLARINLRDDTFRIQRLLATRVLATSDEGTASERLDSWWQRNASKVQFAQNRIHAMQTSGAPDFETLVVAVRELRKLRSL